VATALVDALEEAGVPGGAINLVTGGGGSIGDRLVDHPGVRFIAFTGSKAVGCRINERAARVADGQRWLKRVVVEMGGKDAIVVDEDVDLDAAAAAVVTSAFGFQGQKCSACSRLIVVERVHDDLLDRVIRRTAALTVGNPELPETQMGPLINDRAFAKIREYIDIGRREGTLVQGGEADSATGWFIQPTIFDDVPEDGRLAREEIFGPVLAVTRARTFEDAVRMANATEYGLTGAAWSRNRDRLAHAREHFHVGNLYLNRKCTGAMVGGHPFGGFNMSGTDSKAGGRDYLLLFLQAKSIAERL
jgi:1-pyrroline-5-carboxylate dehydrogenase